MTEPYNVDNVDFSSVATGSLFGSPVSSPSIQFQAPVTTPQYNVAYGGSAGQGSRNVRGSVSAPFTISNFISGLPSGQSMNVSGSIAAARSNIPQAAASSFYNFDPGYSFDVGRALDFTAEPESIFIPRETQKRIADDMPMVEALVPTSNVPGAPIAKVEAQEIVQDRVAKPLQIGEEVGPEIITPAIAKEGTPTAPPPEVRKSHEQRVSDALAESSRPSNKTDFKLSDLLMPGVGENLAASEQTLSEMIVENKKALSEGRTVPHTPERIRLRSDDIDRVRAGTTLLETYLEGYDLGENPNRATVAETLTSALMEQRGVRKPEGLSLEAERNFEYAKREAKNKVLMVLNSTGTAEALIKLPDTVRKSFDSYSERVANEVIGKIDSNLLYSEQLINLPFGYSRENKTGLAALAASYRSAGDALSEVVGPDDKRVKRLYSNGEIASRLSAGAPIRADAYRARTDPLSYLLASENPAAANLAGLSDEALNAYNRDLAVSPAIKALEMNLDRAMTGHEDGSITNDQLEKALTDYNNGVARLIGGMDPIVKKTWYGNKTVSGPDFDFGKLAGMSALILGLYEATYGKERAREQNLEDMMALERFRTDERLRLYSGQVAAQTAGQIQVAQATAGPAPTGSSALSSIAERVS